MNLQHQCRSLVPRRGAALCDFLEAHARKVYSPELNSRLIAAHALASKIRKKAVCGGDTIRDVYRNQWKHLKTADHATAAIQTLEEHGWLAVEVVTGDKGGRPREVIRLNPTALERA